MLKSINVIAIILLTAAFSFSASFSGSDLQKLVDTELAFAKKAADTNTRQAFLDYTADEGVIFNPTVTNAKAFWEKRAVSASWLAWHPTWADVSADGKAGWDIGPWEFHPKGKDDAPTAFGHFCTFWIKQPDGSFKFLVDMGIGYERSGFAEKEVKYPADAGKGSKTVKDQSHYNTLEKLFYSRSLTLAYAPVAADDIILLIEGKAPIVGKKDVMSEFARQDAAYDEKDSTALVLKSRRVYGNLSYQYGEVTVTKADKSARKQNFLQIWKYRDGKWQLVCAVFNDIPDKA
jgi:ketosteroid isomerase-like protein